MSDSKKIVRFTFWMNKIWQIGFVLFSILMINNMRQIAMVTILVSVLASFFEMVYVSRKYHVQVFNQKDELYFAKDERDRDIALKVHSALINTFILLVIALWLLLSILWGMNSLSMSLLFYVLNGWVAFAFIIPDIQYYILWHKYDQQ
ncbi:hypothetical protein [Leuconostoc pseudomesenteroides]|uniref:hypothetical protein n=1 Tax=Leuconostoc pseudomesenteroides TaxID=33968 RepID=UPI001664D31B|nr:hypothetical protein [Leuconostoc pseudomesenteroides]